MNATLEPGQTWMVVRGPNVGAIVDLWSQLREDFARRGRPCHFRRGFIPLLQIQSHGYVVIDTIGAFGGRPGQILQFDYKSSSDFYVLHESLGKWLETMVALLDAGVFFDRLGSAAQRVEWTINGPYCHRFRSIPIETPS
ncbi:hypothetical protein [Nannocystis sp. SCPEA4]|uniref:hypothetical protein n=1 Tax=Nannocystis sp. SCPEA4 TaxID=2996787 RepID=UPI00226F0947|nr:hypothetical protein [Nannocystis sp. SCPEA4]MCY1054877.1 hypothetical protein [Nannocystis sp. SCPEA4]